MISLSYRDSCIEKVFDEYYAVEAFYQRNTTSYAAKALENLQGCRSRAFFLIDKTTRKVHVAGNACRLRWCPMCSKSKAFRITGVVGNWLAGITEKKFITLTIKHSENDIKSQIKHLYRSFLKLRKHEFWKRYCQGGVWFFQIKFCKESQQWHPHLHIVADSKFMFQGVLSDVWLQITQSSKIVDIRAVHSNKKTAEYVARYSARPCDLRNLDAERQNDIIDALHGKRLCGSWGTAKGLDLSGTKRPANESHRRVASYDKVRSMKNDNRFAAILFYCYIHNVPIPDEYSIDMICHNINPNITDPFDTLELDESEVFKYG